MKREYVKPEMLVEAFVATQSVVAACDPTSLHNQKPRYVSPGEHLCGKPDCKNGHDAFEDLLTNPNYTFKDLDGDDQICIFGDSGINPCTEVVYTDASKGLPGAISVSSLSDISDLIMGNKSWGSKPHPPVIDGDPLPSF